MQLVSCLRWLSFLFIVPIHAMEQVVGGVGAPQPAGVAQREIYRGQGYIDLSARALPNLQVLGTVENPEDIHVINASHNQLTHASLTAAQVPSRVKTIDLSHNRLNEFPSTFIQRLPKAASYVDLSRNQIEQIGSDVQLPSRGLRINISHNRLGQADVEALRARIARPDRKLSFMQRCAQYFSRPVSKLTNIIGTAALLGGYALLKKYMVKDPRSKLSRMVKIAQNCLWFSTLIRTIMHNDGARLEIDALFAGLLLYPSAILLIPDTMSLISGFSGFHEQNRAFVQQIALTKHNLKKANKLIRNNRIFASCVYSICASMRAAASVYVAKNCLSWCKNKIASFCNGYVERNRNQLISEPQVQ